MEPARENSAEQDREVFDSDLAELRSPAPREADSIISDHLGVIYDSSAVHRFCYPVQSLLGLVLLTALKDRASELRIGLGSEEVTLVCVIGGKDYELVPPPRYIGEDMGTELERRFGLLKEEQIPAEGIKERLRIFFGGKPETMLVEARPYGEGEKVSLKADARWSNPPKEGEVSNETAVSVELLMSKTHPAPQETLYTIGINYL